MKSTRSFISFILTHQNVNIPYSMHTVVHQKAVCNAQRSFRVLSTETCIVFKGQPHSLNCHLFQSRHERRNCVFSHKCMQDHEVLCKVTHIDVLFRATSLNPFVNEYMNEGERRL